MTSLQEAREDAGERLVEVTRNDVKAARLVVLTSSRLGEPIPEWIQKIADATPVSR